MNGALDLGIHLGIIQVSILGTIPGTTLGTMAVGRGTIVGTTPGTIATTVITTDGVGEAITILGIHRITTIVAAMPTILTVTIPAAASQQDALLVTDEVLLMLQV